VKNKTYRTGKKNTTKSPKSENQVLQQQFHQKVLMELRQIREISKQGSENSGRQQLESRLQKLAQLSGLAKIPSWIELLETAARAIANPENPYRSSVMLIIKEIKQAGELVLAGRQDEIRVSAELEELSPSSPTVTTKVAVRRPSPQEETNENETDLLGWEEVDTEESEGDLDSLFTESYSSEETPQDGKNSEDEANLNDLFADSASVGTETENLFRQKEKKTASKSGTIEAKDTLFLFGQGFSFSESGVADSEKYSNLDSELNDLFDEDFSFEEEPVLAQDSELDRDSEINHLFGEESSAKKEKVDNQKEKKPQREKDTLILFGRGFSFEEETELLSNSKDLESGDLELGDLLGEEVSLDEETEKLSPDTTNSTGEELGHLFEEEVSLEFVKKKSPPEITSSAGDLDLGDLFEEDLSLEFVEEKSPPEITSSAGDLDLGDLFEEDLSLEFVEEKSPPEITSSAGDLDLGDLFEEDLSLEFVEEQSAPERTSSTGDLNLGDLFGEDLSLEFVEEKSTVETTSSAGDLDLGDLFEEDLSLEFVERQETDRSATDLERGDLFEESAPETSGQVKDAAPILVYEQFEELEALIEQPATAELEDFQQLLATIDAPNPAIAEEQTTSLGSKLEQLDKNKIKPDHIAVDDDEFSDLDDLIDETNLTMGGAAAVQAGSKSSQKAGRSSKAKGFEQTMRVPVKQLDNFSNLMGELVVNRNSLEQDQERLRQFLGNLLNQVQNLSDVGVRMQDLYERSLLERALLASRNNYKSEEGEPSSGDGSFEGGEDYDPLEMDRFSGFHLLSQEMIELVVRVKEASSDIEFLVDETEQVARNFRQVTTQLQEGLTIARMIAFGQTGDRLRRAVREISLKLNKQAELHVEGRDVLVDKMILEHLYDPMTHLVNNAITHGIETPEQRRQSGKSPKGNVTIKAFIQGNQTMIVVADDGGGINQEKVKFKAIEKGLITTRQARSMSPHDIYDLIFHPGFTTKDQADQFSGRGVGMDVVRTSLSEIRGTVSIDSKIGQGTTFTIRLPLTLSISKALCCISDRCRMAFPMDGVEDMQDYSPNEIVENSNGEKCVRWRDNLLPFQPLNKLLTYNRKITRGRVYGGQREEGMVSLVVLRSAGNYLAVQVDQVLGEQEIVIKQIEGPMPKPIGIAGATVLGDGRVMPIADVLELIEISQGKVRKDIAHMPVQPEAGQGPTSSEPVVLIVDDSITVRELLSMTFAKAGYRVEQARDGQEAWDKIRSGLLCDIVFCDLEMPRMDGLELLSRVQLDSNLAHLPFGMLTSRGAERHRQMAAELGASGYFTKPYLEEVLLDGAARMIKGEVLLAGSTRQPVEPEPEESEVLEIVEEEPQFVFKQRKVLIIDDSITVRELLSMTFKAAGYLVEQARDGQDAWDKLNSNLKVDVVFCDIEMPRLNGLDLLSRLQEDEQLSQIPVAMLTSRGAERHRRIAAERGANAYFTKPYMDDVLLNAADRLIKGEILHDTLAQVDQDEALVGLELSI